MRPFALAALLLAGCYDFQESVRPDDPFDGRGGTLFRLRIDRLRFPSGDAGALKRLEALKDPRPGIAGGSGYAANGMAAWTLAAGWPAEGPWKIDRSTLFVRAGEFTRIDIVERFDPPRAGEFRVCNAAGAALDTLRLAVKRTSFRAAPAAAGALVDLDLVPVVGDEDGRDHPLGDLGSRFSVEPGRFHLFTAHAQVADSAGALLFLGPSSQVALAIAVEVAGDRAVE